MKNLLLFVCFYTFTMMSCDSPNLLEEYDQEIVDTELNNMVNTPAETRAAKASNNAPFISVFNCVPHAYYLSFNNFNPTIQIKYAIYDLNTNVMLDQDILILTNQNRYITSPVLENCTAYGVAVEARNYPGGPLSFYEQILTTWCPGLPIC